jgi:hypothetical protein
MASIETLSDCDASANNIGYAPAVTRGMLGMWMLGNQSSTDTGGLARSITSKYGIQPLGVTGAPVLSVGYASMIATTNFFTPSIADALTMTFWPVARVVTFPKQSQGNPIISCYGVDTASGNVQAFGSTLNYNAGTGAFPDAGARGSRGYNNGTSIAQNQGGVVDVPVSTNWAFLAAAINGAEGTAGLTKMWNMTAGGAVAITPSGTPTNNTQQTLSIGSANTSTLMQGAQDIAVCGIHNVGLTSAEIASLYAQQKNYLQSKFPSVFPVL